MNPLTMAANLAAFALVVFDAALTWLAGEPADTTVVDAVGPWADLEEATQSL